MQYTYAPGLPCPAFLEQALLSANKQYIIQKCNLVFVNLYNGKVQFPFLYLLSQYLAVLLLMLLFMGIGFIMRATLLYLYCSLIEQHAHILLTWACTGERSRVTYKPIPMNNV